MEKLPTISIQEADKHIVDEEAREVFEDEDEELDVKLSTELLVFLIGPTQK